MDVKNKGLEQLATNVATQLMEIEGRDYESIRKEGCGLIYRTAHKMGYESQIAGNYFPLLKYTVVRMQGMTMAQPNYD